MPLLNSKLVTGDSAFSMFNLSLREEWANNKTFCHRLTEEADAEDKAGEHAENNKAKVSYRQDHLFTFCFNCPPISNISGGRGEAGGQHVAAVESQGERQRQRQQQPRP